MSISTIWQKSNRLLLDLFYPPYCLHCQSAGAWLCESCLGQMSLITDPICDRCGSAFTTTTTTQKCNSCRFHPLQDIDAIRAVADFEDPLLRKAVHAFKYKDQKVLAGALGELLASAFHRFGMRADLIVPVPLHTYRRRERGYNQSELLAEVLADALHLPLYIGILTRTKATSAQVGLNAGQRRQNVFDAFQLDQELPDGAQILLIDDVFTTGATLDSCAATLKAGGAAAVLGLTLARANFGAL